MEVEELYRIPKWAGIYCIKNNINNKCYIGQAIMLRKRLLHHISNYKLDRYNNPLYKAFKKYGLENFSLNIIKEFKGLSKEELKRTLDEQEIYYIEKYNSYGTTGYNQTKGGDGGILGYKMTDAQKEVISKNSKEEANDGRNMIYCYNLLEKSTYIAVTLKALNNILNESLKTSDIRNLLCREKYILSRSLQDLENKKLIVKDKISSSNISTKFTSKLINEMIRDIKDGMKEKDFLHKHKVCKKTYYNYKNKRCEYERQSN